MTKREEALGAGNNDETRTARPTTGPAAFDSTAAGPSADRFGSQLTTLDPERYRDRTLVSEGGMGRIVAALDRRLGRRVALKELRSNRPGWRARFEREAMLTARLQHPGIVSVHDAGQWPDGEPFYAMRLVPGRPFNEVIATTNSHDDRMALLPHVLAVADAIAYAHGQRVIHRDLKPHNIMIGEYGETIVIDWGLAKDLATSDAESGRASSLMGDRPDETSAGDVLGTPAYMPPEQALGEAVDERADVYSIGAILYTLLAGRPPYQSARSVDILRDVLEKPPTPLSELQRGLPPDLLAIVERAMARDPQTRFPTARELAAELRRFQNGQLVATHQYSLAQLLARWVRRNRAAVAVAAIALVIVSVLGVVSVRRILRAERRAESARVVAEQGRADAEGLIDFMVNDLYDGLDEIGKLELLGAVARKASDHYASRPPTGETDELALRARTVQLLGDVMHAQGDEDGALAQARIALSMAERLAARDASYKPKLATLHTRVGDALLGKSDAKGALAAYQSSLAIALETAAHKPVQRETLRTLHTTRQRIGDVQAALGDNASAMSEFQAALVVAEELARTDASDDDAQRKLSLDHQRIADILGTRGENEAALTSYRAAVAVDERRVARNPDNLVTGRDLMISRVALADALQSTGDLAGAIATYRAALAESQHRSTAEPNNANWRRDVAVMHGKLGRAMLAANDTAGAVENARAALALRQKRAEETPDDALAHKDVASSFASLGDALLADKDARAALAEYRAGIASIERSLAKAPDNASYQYIASIVHWGMGDSLLALNDRPGALNAYRASLAMSEKLAAADPTNTDWKDAVSTAREKIASCCGAAP